MSEKKLPPVHPGEILREEFLGPMSLSQYRLANSIGVPPRRINEIFHEKRSISADTALRLGVFFGTSPEFWLNLQTHYDLEVQKSRMGSELEDVRVLTGIFLKSSRVQATPGRITYHDADTSTSSGRPRGAAQASSRKAVKHR